MNSHYRSPLDFSDAALFAAQSGYQKITETVKAVRKRMAQAAKSDVDKKVAEQLKQLREKFEAAMNDDLNTSIALSVVFELVRVANKLLEEASTTTGTLNAVDVLFDRLGGDCLGIVKDEYPQAGWTDDETVGKLVDILIEQRNDARRRRDFAAADAVRDKLEEIGFVVEDKPGETVWRRK